MRPAAKRATFRAKKRSTDVLRNRPCFSLSLSLPKESSSCVYLRGGLANSWFSDSTLGDCDVSYSEAELRSVPCPESSDQRDGLGSSSPWTRWYLSMFAVVMGCLNSSSAACWPVVLA